MTPKLQRFDSADEALEALRACGARFLGGGTLIVRRLNAGERIDTLVRVVDPAMRRIEISEGQIVIGGSVTMSQVARNAALGWLAPAAHAVGGPTVRNMATVGGNLYAPSPYGDFAVALLALDAVVSLTTPAGAKSLPLEEFFRTRDTALRGAIVTSLTIERRPADIFCYRKVSRLKPHGVSVLSLAALIREDNAVISFARIAYGAMAPTPIRARAVEEKLIGRPRTALGIETATSVAFEGTCPADDPIASAWYRRAVLPVHLSRLLTQKG